ncbi:MAG: S1 RNA-binding domain-containing protein [Lactobacillus sp.]|nr:S1 RNA-binding domain-containing protein [Lactobacillus sp.]
MKYQVGDRITGTINKITDVGVFVSLGKRDFGLVHHSDFKDGWAREKLKLKLGQKVRVVVLQNKQGKLALSIKRVNDPELIDQSNIFNKVGPAEFLETLEKTLTNSDQKLTEIKKIIEG